MQKILIIKIQKELEKIKMRYKSRYGAVIFDVKIKNLDDSVFLEGIVLTERQKKETFLAVQEILMSFKIKNKIKVLSEPKENMEIGWGIIKSGIVDIWAIFPDKKKPSEKNRATQAVKGDVMRFLVPKENYYLAQAQDLTIGWVNKRKTKNEKRKTKVKNLKLRWNKVNRAKKSGLYKIKLINRIRKKTISFLENYLYVPYVWGGTTELGIDCSGLVQKFYWEIYRILLPRHSANQAECGEKVSLENAKFGDLIFLRHKTKKYPHIGIIVEKTKNEKRKTKNLGDILILSARREKNGAVIESAEEIFKNYNLISVKRLIKIKK